MAGIPEQHPHLKATAVIVHRNVAKALGTAAISIVHHERNAHMGAQIGVIFIAETHQHQPLQVPHGSKADDFPGNRGLFHHHEQAAFLNLLRQAVQAGGNIAVLQRVAFILLVVINHHPDDP